MGNKLKVGAKALLTKTISDAEVFHFAEISTDKNSLHLDRD